MTLRKTRTLQCVLTTIGVAAGATASAAAEIPYRAVAISGVTQVPGSPPGTTFDEIMVGSLSEGGHVGYVGAYGAFNGAFLESGGAHTKILSSDGDLVPGTSSPVQFAGLPILNTSGDCAISAYYDVAPDFSSYNVAMLKRVGGVVSSVAKSGDIAPGTALAFSRFEFATFNDGGQCAFRAHYGAGQEGFFSTAPGTLTRIAATDGPLVPGTPYSFNNFASELLSGTGRCSFRADYNGGALDGIFAGSASGTLTALLLSNDPAYVDPVNGSTFLSVAIPATNLRGDVLIPATMATPFGFGVYISPADGSPLQRGATTFDIAPGSGGQNFHFIGNGYIDNKGDIVFDGGYGGSSTPIYGIYRKKAGVLSEVVREGGPISGPNPIFGTRYNVSVARSSGQIAFTGEAGGAVGLWLTDAAGVPQIVAQAGMTWDYDGMPGGVSKVITDVLLYGGSTSGDGQTAALNDRGEVAFVLNFADNSSGLYVARIPTCLRGDANCDGSVNNFDIDYFVQGVLNIGVATAPAPYLASGGSQACWDLRECWGDSNGDTAFNNFDIDGFVACILSAPAPGEACP